MKVKGAICPSADSSSPCITPRADLAPSLIFYIFFLREKKLPKAEVRLCHLSPFLFPSTGSFFKRTSSSLSLYFVSLHNKSNILMKPTAWQSFSSALSFLYYYGRFPQCYVSSTQYSCLLRVARVHEFLLSLPVCFNSVWRLCNQAEDPDQFCNQECSGDKMEFAVWQKDTKVHNIERIAYFAVYS